MAGPGPAEPAGNPPSPIVPGPVAVVRAYPDLRTTGRRTGGRPQIEHTAGLDAATDLGRPSPMRKTQWLLSVVLIALAALGPTNVAVAGKCGSIVWEPQDHINRTDAIFRGTVIAVEPSGQDDATISVNVDTIWKGSALRVISIFVHGYSNPLYAVKFAVGKTYIFFANGNGGTLSLGSCDMQPYWHGHPSRRDTYTQLLDALGALRPKQMEDQRHDLQRP